MIVLDASVVLELILRTTAATSIENRLLGELLHAPHLVDIEVAHVVRRATFAGLAVATGQQALAIWQGFSLTRHSHEMLLPRIWQLRQNLTAYDASYVALAEALNAPLVTHDRRLAGSTGHTARIELV